MQPDLEQWPTNDGSAPTASCASPLVTGGRVYTPTQVQTAYGVDQLKSHAAGTPIVTVLDLGGGWLATDLQKAGDCWGFKPPTVVQTQGDGVAEPIANADDETSLDVQTVAAVAPNATMRLVQTTSGGAAVLDGLSRAIDDPGGAPRRRLDLLRLLRDRRGRRRT